MDRVVVNREELLAKLKVNRDEHRKIFLEAQERYREFMIDELDKMLQEARDGKAFQRSVTLQEPVDHTSEYDTVIAMLEMSQDETIDITQHDFACYVLDKWNWKRSFLTCNSAYSAAAVSGLASFDG